MLWVCAGVLVLLMPVGGQVVVQDHWPTPSTDYPHRAELDESARFFLFWSFDGDVITLEAHARTQGWLGLGISPQGGMKGADIVVGWVKDGKPFLQDRYAEGMVQPVVDASQDVDLLDAREDAQFTMIRFQRKLRSCDKQDRNIEEGTVRVIFAWGTDDPESVEEVKYHGARQRGVRSLILLEYSQPVRQEQSEQLLTFDMTMNQLRLAPNRTVYWCRIFRLPQVTSKHHIVKVRPIVTPGNEGVVHHMVTFFCHGNLQQDTYGNQCWEGNMPDNATECDTIAYGWALGQGDFNLPEETGIPFGGPHDPAFFHIQMHYDNPEMLDNVVDSSGLRFYYTDVLRPHDTGVLMLGHSIWWPPMFIPPGTEEFHVEAFCSKTCTQPYIPPEGIHVYAAFLHTHLLGTRIWTRHIRDKQELPEVVREDHYDFNFQFVRNLKKPTHILPGDEFLTTCVYNSMSRQNITYGGLGTADEMCLSFFYYYPRVALQSCLSTTMDYYPVHQLVMKKAMTGEVDINPDDDKMVYDYLKVMEWTRDDVQHVQKQVYQAPGYEQQCTISKSGFGVFGGSSSTYEKKVKVDKPLLVEDDCQLDISRASSAQTQLPLVAVVLVTLHLLYWMQ